MIDKLNQILQWLIEKSQKAHICVSCNTQQTLSTTEKKISLSELHADSNAGDVFEPYNGGVRVLKDSYVSVTGALYSNTGLAEGDLVYIGFYINSTRYTTVQGQKVGAPNANTFTIAECILKLNAGDVLYIYALNQSGPRGTIPTYYQNRLTVKEL